MGFRKVQKDFEMIDKLSEGQNKIENGQGTYTYPNGEKYVGEWKDGEQNGQGTYTYPNGDKYVGEFKDDKQNGQGTKSWNDGWKDFGSWKNGEIWNGTEYDEDGKIWSKYVNGKKIKQ